MTDIDEKSSEGRTPLWV